MSLTAADKSKLATYLRVLADRMSLKDWSIEVQTEPADPEAHAEVRCVDGRKLAKMRFAHDWHEQAPEVLRHTCCHELIHCHFAMAWADQERRLEGADRSTFVMHLEYGIDGMADAIAPFMPLFSEIADGPTQPR